jgi:hypothetical protein
MNDIVRKVPIVKGLVADYFSIESPITSSRSGDLGRAVDLSRDEPVLLWVMRHGLALQSDAPERFLGRLKKFQDIVPIGQILLQAGVDSTGVGFVSLKPLEGGPLQSGSKGTGASTRAGMAEGERRLVAAVRLVEAVHQGGLVCGDLCASSFWVDRAGELLFTGVLGSFDSDVQATSLLPSPEIAQYFAPEQLSGIQSQASDVYALGVLGYYLLSGVLPFDGVGLDAGGGRTEPRPISEAVSGAPLWAEEVLARCLSADPVDRYPTAGELLKGIAEARQRAFSQADLPARKSSQVTAQKGSGAQSAGLTTGRSVAPWAQAADADSASRSAEESAEASLFQRLRLPVAVVAVFVMSAIVGAQLTSRGLGGKAGEGEAPAHDGAITDNPKIKRVIEVRESSKEELSEAAASFDALVSSDDPLAHVELVRSVVEARSPQIRELAQRSLTQRVRRLGMIRSAEQLMQWARTIPSGSTPPAYEPILKALNATLPIDARTAELRKAYVSDPRVALRIAAAIALDAQNIAEYQELLSQLVGDSLALEDARSYAGLALIMAHPELALTFGDDVVQRRGELSDGDVLWLLGVLGNRNDYNVRAFASLAVERGILTPLRREYLEVVRDRQDVPPDVLQALVKGAAGALTAEDIGAIGRWFDREVERILMVVCAEVDDPALRVEAFDILAGKTLTKQPSAMLVDWVRRNAWENRSQFVRSIGVLGNLGKVSDEEAKEAFRAFEPLLKDSRVINAMLDTNDPFVTKLILERYSASLGLGSLLSMLRNKDKEVRILAIQSLKNFNDVGALKLILDSYDQETDPAVRTAYQENFWMIREREQKAGGTNH